MLYWLAIGLLPSLLNGTIELYLYAAGDELYATRLRALSVIAQLGSGVALVYFFGASGAAISIVLGELAIWIQLNRRAKMILENSSRMGK